MDMIKNEFETLYPAEERKDAGTIDSIAKKIFENLQHSFAYQPVLEMIYNRIPENYINEFLYEGKRYIKFWAEKEFYEYVSANEFTEDICALGNAYPRACYYLSVVLIEAENYLEAEAVINMGLTLQPRHPILMCQMGNLLLRMAGENYDKLDIAYNYYSCILDLLDETSTKIIAAVLRGMAHARKMQGENDTALLHVRDSLHYDENNSFGLEMLYELENS